MRFLRMGRGAPARSLALLATLVLSSIPATAAAQAREQLATVRGRVIDAETGEPITAAVVRLAEVHRAEPTHGDGNFVLRDLAGGEYTLIVQRIGYRPHSRQLTVGAGQTVTVEVRLTVAAVRLAPQVVTGTVGTRAGQDVLSPTSVLSEADLDRQLSTTVAATVRNVPGVSTSSIGQATSRPVIRGLGGDRILVLEDGQRPGDLSSLSGDHAVAVDPLTAQRIEVVRGPMSLLYGSSALGGVVNVVREEIPESVPDHLHGSISAQGESALSAFAAGGELRAAAARRIAVRGDVSARGSGETRTPLGRLANTDSRAFGGAFGAAYVGPSGHVGAAYRMYASDYGIPGGFVGSHPEGVDVEMRRHSVRAEGEHHPEGAIATGRATVTLNDYSHNEIEKSGRVGTAFVQQSASAEVVVGHGIIGHAHEGALGVRGQYRSILTGGSLRTPSTRDYNIALYAVEELGHGTWRLQLGARYDHAHYEPQRQTVIIVGDRSVRTTPRTFGSFSGAIGTLYAPREGVRIGANVSRAYRTPDFNELYSSGPHLAANAFEVGDPELRQETGVGADLFARITRERLHVEVAVFRNWLNDYISPSSRGDAVQSPQGQPVFQFTNQDAVFTGAEGELQLRVAPRVVVDAVLSHVVAQFTGGRDPIPVFVTTPTGLDTAFVPASRYPALIPPTNGRVELRYEQPRYFGAVGSRFAMEQSRVGDFEEPTSGYAVAHMSVGYRLLRGSTLGTLTLRVDNLLDTVYREHLSRVKAIMPEPGRSVSLLYRLAF
jgi:iron complex outermembrane recepter protein